MTGRQRVERAMRRLGLRTRLMIIGVAGLVLGLGLGSLVFYGVMTYTLSRTIDNEGLTSAHQVAAMVDDDQLPQPIPVSGAQVIQVIDAQGRVRAASIGADRLIPLLRPDERVPGRITVPGQRAGLTEPLRVISIAAGSAENPQLVLVALPIGDVNQSARLLRAILLVAYPMLVLALALLAWRVIGWTLRPVETLRADADRISGSGRATRLAVPDAADELRALAETLNRMLDRLAASRERQRAFAADAAHELRSPLASMRTQLEVAQRLDEDVDPTELLPDVTRLTQLVEDLLLLARVDADAAPPPLLTSFDVTELLRSVVQGYPSPSVAIAVYGTDNLVAQGAPDEIRRAVHNLVDNALRHAKSTVTLTSAQEPDGVILAVTDDGPGIPEAYREHVFDRFIRLDDARNRD
ncbi:MAG: HAMP domain-containing protein, partial [Longispora sp.]|nr:HAMP domain-containing protein [Longispora sp. (in: high G+C Gram-positive bacteria)]